MWPAHKATQKRGEREDIRAAAGPTTWGKTEGTGDMAKEKKTEVSSGDCMYCNRKCHPFGNVKRCIHVAGMRDLTPYHRWSKSLGSVEGKTVVRRLILVLVWRRSGEMRKGRHGWLLLSHTAGRFA